MAKTKTIKRKKIKKFGTSKAATRKGATAAKTKVKAVAKFDEAPVRKTKAKKKKTAKRGRPKLEATA
jgi:hypothetical protein